MSKAKKPKPKPTAKPKPKPTAKPKAKPAPKSKAQQKAAEAKKLETILRKASAARTSGEPELACKLLRSAQPLAKSVKTRAALWTAWNAPAQFHLGRREWELAAMFYAGGVEVAPRPGDNTGALARMCNELGYVLHQLGRLDEAEAAVQRAFALHREADRQDGIASTHYHMSGIEFDRGNIDGAIASARSALAISRETGNRNDEAYHAYALARSLNEQGHSAEADKVSRDAVTIAKELRITAVEASLVNMIANVALEDHRSEEAEEAYIEAGRLFGNLGLKTHEAITIANRGNLAWDCDRLDDALASYKTALAQHKKDNDHRSVGIVLTDRAGVLAELGRFEESERDLVTALEIMQRIGHVRRLSFVRDMFAKLAEERRELETARAHYAEAEMSFEAVGDNIQIGRMLLAMAGLQAEVGDPGGAQLLLDRAGVLDPASRGDYTPAPSDPPPRAGTAATRALRELATGRIELANARFATDPAVAQTLRDAAAARLAAVESPADSLVKRSSEVRRVARRLRAALAAS